MMGLFVVCRRLRKLQHQSRHLRSDEPQDQRDGRKFSQTKKLKTFCTNVF